MDDLDDSIISRREAVAAHSPRRPNCRILLYRLCIAVLTLLYQLGRFFLNSLAHSLWSRFQHLRRIKDLGEAAVLHGDAVECLPSRHPDRINHIENLANVPSILSEALDQKEHPEGTSTVRDEIRRGSPHGNCEDRPARTSSTEVRYHVHLFPFVWSLIYVIVYRRNCSYGEWT